MANTSLPCSNACLAVIREPLCRAASTKRQPLLMPLMIRLRRGKLLPMGGVPRGNSDTRNPFPQARGQVAVRRRIDFIQAGSYDSYAGRHAAQAATMGCSIYSARHSANYAQARIAHSSEKVSALAMPTGVALRLPTTASAGVQQFTPPFEIEKRGRVRDVE